MSEEAFKLSADDLAAVRKKAREQVIKEQRDAAFKAALDAAIEQERIAAGLEARPGQPADVPTHRVLLTLPENVAPYPAIVIDGRPYYEGMPYPEVAEPVAIQLKEMAFRAWQNQDAIEGKFKERRRPKPIAISQQSGHISGHQPIEIVRNAA